ncbi:hypothetical protein MKW92_051348 [Papaver armeniacum]|nr:hypothetical protein MKW92_051348 [Papaver armeniacum]
MASFDFSIQLKSKEKSNATSKTPAGTEKKAAAASSSSAEPDIESTSRTDENELPESANGGEQESQSESKSVDTELPKSTNCGEQESQSESKSVDTENSESGEVTMKETGCKEESCKTEVPGESASPTAEEEYAKTEASGEDNRQSKKPETPPNRPVSPRIFQKGFLKKFLLKNSEFKCSYKGEDLGWDISITKGSNLAVEKKASASVSTSTSPENKEEKKKDEEEEGWFEADIKFRGLTIDFKLIVWVYQLVRDMVSRLFGDKPKPSTE